ncbi:MAG: D-alanyl-D-alanine carboxypeptidase/D-alanyl-D-alanine-endopeptidase [Acidobacteriota bacterium]
MRLLANKTSCRCGVALLLLFITIGITAAAMPVPVRKKPVKSAPIAERKLPSARNLAQLKQQLRTLINNPELAAAQIGVSIMTETDARVIFEQDAHKLLVPASNMKLYTTAAALVQLGANYRIRTSVYAPVRPDEKGVIKGNLILYGRGDPGLASRFIDYGEKKYFELLTEQLISAGVKLIEGDLIADESYLSGSPLGKGWEWLDLQWQFGAEVSALTVHDNSVQVSLQPGAKVGDPCIIRISPEVGYVSVENRIQTIAAGGKRELGINRGLQDNSLLVWGQMPVDDTGFQAYLAVHRPAGLAAALFQAALLKAGIRITGGIKIADASLRSQVPPSRIEESKLIELAYLESPPLSELVRVVNKFSQNLYAELLLRILGRLKGTPTRDSDEAGVEVLKEVLRTAGIDPNELVINDGSGLSRRTLVTTATTARLLAFMSRQPTAQIFLDSLPIAAIDGTLTKRMSGTPASDNVRAKTGTLSYTTALSGYVTTGAGERLVFSIIINHFTEESRVARTIEDGICALLAAYSHKLEGKRRP